MSAASAIRSRRMTSQSSQHPCRKVPSATRTRRASSRSDPIQTACSGPWLTVDRAESGTASAGIAFWASLVLRERIMNSFELLDCSAGPYASVGLVVAIPIAIDWATRPRARRRGPCGGCSSPSSCEPAGGPIDLLGAEIAVLGQVAHVAGGHLRRAEAAVGSVLEMQADLRRGERQQRRRHQHVAPADLGEHVGERPLGRIERAVREIRPGAFLGHQGRQRRVHPPERQLQVLLERGLTPRPGLGTLKAQRHRAQAGHRRRGERDAQAEDQPDRPRTSHDDLGVASM